MTVEEKILQYVGDSAKPTVKRLLKEHTIQIAEKAVEEAVPSNWCDPLLTSDSKVIISDVDCREIEALLNAVKKRILSRIKTLTENEE